MAVTAGQPRIFLSNLLAGRRDRRQAGASILLSLMVFGAVAPFARVPLASVWAFIPGYQAALVVCDLITAILLLAQFAILSDRSLLVLAQGYLFTAFMAVAHALTFPGLFAAAGILGGNGQTTAWLYMAWHAGFPLTVVGYALLRNRDHQAHPAARTPVFAIGIGTVLTIGAACGLTLLATAGHDLLPAIMAGNRYTEAMLSTVGSVWGLSLLALLILVWLRPHSVLDVWLMAVLVAWLCDMGLSAVLNGARFDLGFYAGRIFGLIAANFVLLVLLIETITIYAQLVTGFERERVEREGRLNELQQELIHVGRVNELGQMVSALTHELRQPLTAATNYLAAAQALVQGAEPSKSAAMLGRASEQLVRANDVIERIREFVRKGEVARRPEELAAVIREAAELAMAGAQGRSVSLRILFDRALPLVLIDRIQIQQVVLNLMRNAIEAMAESPTRELTIRTVPGAEGSAEITVADTGPGLPAAVRDRLFQPFVTTKESGMGVGLSICRAIIEAHGGRIWTSEDSAGGTVFHFTVACLDSADRPTDSERAGISAPIKASGSLYESAAGRQGFGNHGARSVTPADI